MAVDRILERLLALHPKKIDLSLDRMHRLLAALGHPERDLPPLIHVAGTNGKGSVIAYLRAMAEAAGLSVHVYTSPHLVRFNERIRLNGKLIEDEALEALLQECEAANGGAPITFFEITTAAALLAFARRPADLLLLEVGLGGRLDATNVVDRPLASVITPIAMDHLEFLGDDLAGIAGEKAGIIKPGVPALIGFQEPVAFEAIKVRADQMKAPIAVAGQDWRSRRETKGWVYEEGDYRQHLPMPGLIGAHQIDNAALAVATARRARLPIGQAAIKTGVETASWPARLQRVETPDIDAELLIDGGHNPAAAAALARALDGLPPKRLLFIIGMLANRDVADFLAPIKGPIKEIWAVPLPGHDSHAPEDIAATAAELGIEARSFTHIAEALERLRNDGPWERVLIGGSLYLAGEALRELGQYPD